MQGAAPTRCSSSGGLCQAARRCVPLGSSCLSYALGFFLFLCQDKKYASDKYKDIYTELSIVKAKADCDISRLKEQLKAATEAQGEKSPVNTTVSGYGQSSSSCSKQFWGSWSGTCILAYEPSWSNGSKHRTLLFLCAFLPFHVASHLRPLLTALPEVARSGQPELTSRGSSSFQPEDGKLVVLKGFCHLAL